MESIPFSDVADAITIVIAALGVWIANQGLNTWRKQLTGGVEYDLTRRLLITTFQLRDAIRDVRNHSMMDIEMSTSHEEAEGLTPQQREFVGYTKAYANRWKPVTAIRNDLRTGLLEAEVLWGKEIYEKFNPVFKLQAELNIEIRHSITLRNPYENEAGRDAITRIRRGKRSIMYDESNDDEPDQYTVDMNRAVETIENYLKPHLRK